MIQETAATKPNELRFMDELISCFASVRRPIINFYLWMALHVGLSQIGL